MSLFRHSTLPLGLDIGAQSVSIVCTSPSGDGLTIRETSTIEVPRVDAAQLDFQVAETLGRIVRGLATKERRCIVAAPAGDVVARVFRTPPGMRRAEAARAAVLEADTIVDWPAAERLVALDPLPGVEGEMLLSIARARTVERIVAIARAGGLRPVAVDIPACAWRRAVPYADAVLDCSSERAELTVFGKTLGVTSVFPPRLIDERLAGQVRAAFVEARREGTADVQRLAVLASRYRFESMEQFLRDDGCAVSLLTLGGLDAPSWSLAFGLASWSSTPVRSPQR